MRSIGALNLTRHRPRLLCGGMVPRWEGFRGLRHTIPGRLVAATTDRHLPRRGALLKPWLFTEIKEQRHWDISSSERLDILRDFTNYGLEHWGSDTQGVEKTRRFLLQWLSFLCRYVPVGLLERLPQRINERPPYYLGRDYLETLMASQKADDWIRISEMLLGPVPPNFTFLPKHKANAYK
ncbi:tRNA-dihydrouridine(47) synthase [NAD(P)(+)]-like protein [Saguinus oedipus]|uniref:tRNA-dihydrouridine(47) synthase [NAD(P)(+)]-like protein n=1 Tax=Saguinus oedipus TaxID=9490 RepID=A0ABQ9TR62_SAGOE|nr:tRNA-dihydrouridine(47) synthase [NAD(P)(+)]-like protein [Saguinus oedipus]